MSSGFVFLFILFTGACYAAPSRIVGGEITTIEKYPSIVQTEAFSTNLGVWKSSCGGNILTPYYILSAAHCFDGRLQINNYRIRAGTSYLFTGGIVVYIQHAINHPTYGIYSRFDGDISVIRLLNPLEFSPVIQPVTILKQGAVVPDNMPLVHAGWGRTLPGGASSYNLRHVTVYTVNNAICRERYLTLPPNQLGIVSRNMICAGLLGVGGADACQGDSGGPLYFQNIVVGIASWGYGCGNASFPGVSAAVAPYSDWIASVVM